MSPCVKLLNSPFKWIVYPINTSHIDTLTLTGNKDDVSHLLEAGLQHQEAQENAQGTPQQIDYCPKITVYLKSLDPLYVRSYYIELDKASWIYISQKMDQV